MDSLSENEEDQSPMSESPKTQANLFKGGEADGEISPSTPVYLGPAKVKKSNYQILNTFKSKNPSLYQEALELAMQGEQKILQQKGTKIHIQFKLKHKPGVENVYVTGNIPQLGNDILSKAKPMLKRKNCWTLWLHLEDSSIEFKYNYIAQKGNQPFKEPQNQKRIFPEDFSCFDNINDLYYKSEDTLLTK